MDPSSKFGMHRADSAFQRPCVKIMLPWLQFRALIFVFVATMGCLSLAVPTVVFAQATDAAPKTVKFGIEKHGAIVYRKTEKYLVKCDIYQPIADADADEQNGEETDGKPKVKPAPLMPAIVMIHGGAWRAGSKISMLRHARRLTRVGYVVMAINYRLAPKYPWPAQIEDCRAALDWLHDHAGQYNIDTQRVGVYGYSAGAHLAAMLATTNENNNSIKIRAAAVGGTPAEFSWIDDDSNALVYWLGATREEDADVYVNASPISFVTPDDPPVIVFHGDADLLVPVESARRLHAALEEQNVDSELVEVAGYGHIGTFSKMDLMVDVIKFFDQHLTPQAAPPAE